MAMVMMERRGRGTVRTVTKDALVILGIATMYDDRVFDAAAALVDDWTVLTGHTIAGRYGRVYPWLGEEVSAELAAVFGREDAAASVLFGRGV